MRKLCAKCAAPFDARSGRAKFCPDCKTIAQCERHARYYAANRERLLAADKAAYASRPKQPRQTPSPKPAQNQPDGWRRGGVAVLRLGE